MKENMQPTPNSCFLCGDLEELQNNAICIGRVLESLACFSLSRDFVLIEPKRKLPPQGGRTLKGRRKKKRKRKGREKEERKELDKE
jgi:hypothetical protein